MGICSFLRHKTLGGVFWVSRSRFRKTTAVFSSMIPLPQQAELYYYGQQAAKTQAGCLCGFGRSVGTRVQDILLSLRCRMAHGITVKLQTWLLSRTQLRISLHSGFNIPGNNCSFLLHDIMLNYISLHLVFRMGYSDSQTIQRQLTPTSETHHTGEFTPITLIRNCFPSVDGYIYTHIHRLCVDDPELARTLKSSQHKKVRECVSYNPGDNFHLLKLLFTFMYWPPAESGRLAAGGKF